MVTVTGPVVQRIEREFSKLVIGVRFPSGLHSLTIKNIKMFTAKKTSLFEAKTTSATSNSFVNAGLKTSAKTRSGNGALKYSTTGNDFVDQFGKLGAMKVPRSYADVSKDMSTLWGQDPETAVKFALYIRTITRTTQLFDGSKTEHPQRGAGLRNEGIMRMLWLAINHKEVFWKNVPLFVSLGSWKDIIQMLSFDLQYNGWEGRQLDWNKFGSLILAGLENENTSNLIKKFLPQIKANSQCKTVSAQADNMIAKWVCSLLFGTKESGSTYKSYRKFKTSGTAHDWQKLISKKLLNDINFDSIHGRALALLVSGKFITKNGLEKVYEKWIESKPIAKFTGYPHELFAKAPQKKFQIDTLNAQFKGLVETAKKGAVDGTSLIVVRDTSASMSSQAPGTKQSCYDIGKALALFFSEMLPSGHFANSWIEFNSDAKMHQWKGSTPWEKWTNDKSYYVGSTDFQSVIRLFTTIKKSGVSESEFPTGILCISDSEFNPTQLGKTNVETARETLKSAGFSDEYCKNFKIVLWNLQNNYYGRGSGKKFETHGETENVHYFSGYDGSVIAFLTGVNSQKAEPKTDVELFEAAMDQEVLNMVQI